MNWQGVCCCFAAKIGSTLFKWLVLFNCHSFAQLSDKLCPKTCGRPQKSACRTPKNRLGVNGELMFVLPIDVSSGCQLKIQKLKAFFHLTRLSCFAHNSSGYLSKKMKVGAEFECGRAVTETAVSVGSFMAIKDLWEVRIQKITEELRKQKEFSQKAAGR